MQQLLATYLQFFADHGVPNLTGQVRIEQQQPCPHAVSPEQEMRWMQMLQYFAKIYRSSNRAKAKGEAAEQIKVLGQMSFSSRGH